MAAAPWPRLRPPGRSFNMLNIAAMPPAVSTAFAHRNLARLLLQARESLMVRTRPGLREHGLSDQQWRVLLGAGGDGHLENRRVAREGYVLGAPRTGGAARRGRGGAVRRGRHPPVPARAVV